MSIEILTIRLQGQTIPSPNTIPIGWYWLVVTNQSSWGMGDG